MRDQRAEPARTDAASPPELELWQTEWCPASRRVRERLTELALPFRARPVPAERESRDELAAVSGQRAIPVLLDGGRAICGEQAILEHLERAFPEPPGAAAHRERAIKARRKELEESCRQLEPSTR